MSRIRQARYRSTWLHSHARSGTILHLGESRPRPIVAISCRDDALSSPKIPEPPFQPMNTREGAIQEEKRLYRASHSSSQARGQGTSSVPCPCQPRTFCCPALPGQRRQTKWTVCLFPTPSAVNIYAGIAAVSVEPPLPSSKMMDDGPDLWVRCVSEYCVHPGRF